MAARSAVDSLDRLADASDAYPWAETFRTAYGRQMFALAHRIVGIGDSAEKALVDAVEHDPRSIELMSMLYAVQRDLRHCEQAKITGDRLLALARGSERAKTLVSLPCG